VDGTTVFAADLVPLVEEVLPERFGGAVGHYQLAEQEDETGLPCLRLNVDPAVGPIDEAALTTTVLEHLAGVTGAYELMGRLWKDGRALSVERCPPVTTGRGKLLPVRTLAANPNEQDDRAPRD
jgi:hypothetical protein